MRLRVTIVEELEKVPAVVSHRWAQARRLAFDQTPEWYGLLYTHVLKEQYDTRIIVITSPGGEPLGVVPLALTKKAVLPFGTRRLRSLSNYYTSAFAPISFRDGTGSYIADELAVCLSGMDGDADVVQLEPMARDERSFKEVSAALDRHGYFLAPYRRFSNWFHELDGQTFESYLRSREGALRNTYNRKEKKLRNQGYELEIVRRPSDVASGFAQYNAVYQRSWKIPESHPHFIEAVCQAFAEHDWLRLGLIRVNGTPIAAQIWFVKDRVASIFKLAYDERHKSLSAGTVLSMALLRQTIDVDKVTKIDYLTGDDAYKVQYMSRCREMWCLQAYRKASFAGVMGLYESSKTKLRYWLSERRGREVAN